MSEHFEEKEGRMCAMTQCYTQYLQLCIEQNLNNALEEFQFAKVTVFNGNGDVPLVPHTFISSSTLLPLYARMLYHFYYFILHFDLFLSQ